MASRPIERSEDERDERNSVRMALTAKQQIEVRLTLARLRGLAESSDAEVAHGVADDQLLDLIEKLVPMQMRGQITMAFLELPKVPKYYA
jgi:hypothetical protein